MKKKILIIVENIPVPFDTRVWNEARSLQTNGYEVTVLCPRAKGCSAPYELLEGGAPVFLVDFHAPRVPGNSGLQPSG